MTKKLLIESEIRHFETKKIVPQGKINITAYEFRYEKGQRDPKMRKYYEFIFPKIDYRIDTLRR